MQQNYKNKDKSSNEKPKIIFKQLCFKEGCKAEPLKLSRLVRQ